MADPGDDRRIRDELLDLAENDPPAFDRRVAEYVTERRAGEEKLYRSTVLLQHTYDALNRLLTEADQRIVQSRLTKEDRARWQKLREAYGREMRVVRPLLKQVLSRANPRRVAEKILGRVRYPELKLVMRELERGRSEAEAEDALRAHIQRGE